MRCSESPQSGACSYCPCYRASPPREEHQGALAVSNCLLGARHWGRTPQDSLVSITSLQKGSCYLHLPKEACKGCRPGQTDHPSRSPDFLFFLSTPLSSPPHEEQIGPFPSHSFPLPQPCVVGGAWPGHEEAAGLLPLSLHGPGCGMGPRHRCSS